MALATKREVICKYFRCGRYRNSRYFLLFVHLFILSVVDSFSTTSISYSTTHQSRFNGLRSIEHLVRPGRISDDELDLNLPLRKRSRSCLFDKKQFGDDRNDEMIPDAIKNANWLEIHLDATLASCYGLCRFLIFDITTGVKDIPGWHISDFIMLGGAFSSCIVLSITWTIVGIYTGIFEARYSDDYELLNLATTATIVGPLWLTVETECGWPPGGIILANHQFAVDSSIILYTISTGTIGLMLVMCLGQLFTSRRWR